MDENIDNYYVSAGEINENKERILVYNRSTFITIIALGTTIITIIVGSGLLLNWFTQEAENEQTTLAKITFYKSSSNPTSPARKEPKGKNRKIIPLNNCAWVNRCPTNSWLWCLRHGKYMCHPEESGWLVMLRKTHGDVNFSRGWDDYVKGFGNPGGDYWLGLEKLHLITGKREKFMLRVEVKSQEHDTMRWGEYTSFSVASSMDNYRILLGGYRGNFYSDSFSLYNRTIFKTHDKNYKSYTTKGLATIKCPAPMRNGWWHYLPCDDYVGLSPKTMRVIYSGMCEGMPWPEKKPCTRTTHGTGDLPQVENRQGRKEYLEWGDAYDPAIIHSMNDFRIEAIVMKLQPI